MQQVVRWRNSVTTIVCHLTFARPIGTFLANKAKLKIDDRHALTRRKIIYCLARGRFFASMLGGFEELF
jgi:hypothetical protein